MTLPQSWQKREPGLDRDAIRELEKLLTKKSTVFEFGTGGSTTWFAKRVGQLVSVEYDPDWFRILYNGVYSDFNGIPTHVKISLASDTHHNLWVISQTTGQQIGLDFIDSIRDYPDDHFDVVLVDGRARVACMLNARRKVKPGGTILLDDSQRTWYQDGIMQMSDWEFNVFGDDQRQSIFFKKPKKDVGLNPMPQNALICIKIYPQPLPQ